MPKLKTGPMTIEDTNNVVLNSAAQPAPPASEAPPPPLTLSQVNAFLECAKMGYNMNVDPDRYMQILQAARSWLKQERGSGGKVAVAVNRTATAADKGIVLDADGSTQ